MRVLVTAATGVNRNLGKTIGPLKILHRKHHRCGVKNISHPRKCPSAVAGSCELDVIAPRPDSVDGTVGAHSAVKAFQGAVVIPRQARLPVDLPRRGPAFAIVGGSGKDDPRILQAPAGPGNVKIASVFAVTGIGHD